MKVLLCQALTPYWNCELGHLIGKLTQLLLDMVMLVEFKPICANCAFSDTDATYKKQTNFSPLCPPS